MIKKGAIVLIPFPFTDLSGQKLRPALVLADLPRNNDVIVVFISSLKIKNNNLLDILVKADKINGLKKDSLIKCSKIATLDKKILIGELGQLSFSIMKKVDIHLKKILNL